MNNPNPTHNTKRHMSNDISQKVKKNDIPNPTQKKVNYKLKKTMKLSKKEALKKIEELKKYVSDEETKEKGYIIRNRYDESEIYVSTKDNVRDAVIEAIESKADLSGANLSWTDLTWTDLNGANLSKADLSKANLTEANLFEANLTGANLFDANLSKANLTGANLTGAGLNCAKFYGKGGISKLKKDQVEDFLNALGFQIENE